MVQRNSTVDAKNRDTHTNPSAFDPKHSLVSARLREDELGVDPAMGRLARVLIRVVFKLNHKLFQFGSVGSVRFWFVIFERKSRDQHGPRCERQRKRKQHARKKKKMTDVAERSWVYIM